MSDLPTESREQEFEERICDDIYGQSHPAHDWAIGFHHGTDWYHCPGGAVCAPSVTETTEDPKVEIERLHVDGVTSDCTSQTCQRVHYQHVPLPGRGRHDIVAALDAEAASMSFRWAEEVGVLTDRADVLSARLARVRELHRSHHYCANDDQGYTYYAADDEGYEPCLTWLAVLDND